MAVNRFYYSTKYKSRSEVIARGIKCVFISHQKSDKIEARKIADYLIAANIDVYFDEYDKDLKIHHQSNNSKAVTAAICQGINNSSHMLVIVSPNTLYSTWVPFEVGYGYERTDLAVLCLKGIPKGKLPEYIRTATVVRDIYDFNKKISNWSGQSENLLMENKQIFSANNYSHPLANIMDSFIHDTY